ncbi:MAG: S1C family serine protease [Planctomycetota bacterium]
MPAPLRTLLLALLAVAALPGRAGDQGADLALARAWERHVQVVIAQVRSSAVTISVPGVERREGRASGRLVRSGGSGVVISAEGWVLTCDHVTDEAEEVLVGLADGRTLEGRVVGRDPVGDVSLIRVPKRPGLVAARLGDSCALRRGDPVLALGNPFGLAADDHLPAATLGIVSGLHRAKGGRKIYGDAIQLDAPVNPGNSGGPLFDLEGRLVGLNGRISVRGIQRSNVGVGFAVPIHQVIPILPDLQAGRTVSRGWLGLTYVLGSDGKPGAVIDQVDPTGPAAAAGLRPGDRILRAGGQAIEHPVRLKNAISLLPAGAEVSLLIERGGKRREVRVTLVPRRTP